MFLYQPMGFVIYRGVYRRSSMRSQKLHLYVSKSNQPKTRNKKLCNSSVSHHDIFRVFKDCVVRALCKWSQRSCALQHQASRARRRNTPTTDCSTKVSKSGLGHGNGRPGGCESEEEEIMTIKQKIWNAFYGLKRILL
jgi:hypothetical protein